MVVFWLFSSIFRRFEATQDEIRSAYKRRSLQNLEQRGNVATCRLELWNCACEAWSESPIPMWIRPQMQPTGGWRHVGNYVHGNIWKHMESMLKNYVEDDVEKWDTQWHTAHRCARFIQAQEAFRWLSDPQQREVYAWSQSMVQKPEMTCRDA